MKLLAKNTIFSGFYSRRSLIHEKSYIDPHLCEEFINRGLNEELLPVLLPILRHKSFAQNFCQGHTLNDYCAKLASNFNAKVGLLTLSDPRQLKNCVFSIFIILTSLHLERPSRSLSCRISRIPRTKPFQYFNVSFNISHLHLDFAFLPLLLLEQDNL